MSKILDKPVFVVGCMRSGTTMLADLLGMHPNIIHCPFELRMVWSRSGNVPMASPKTKDRTCPCLQATDVKPGQAERLSKAFLQEMIKNKGKKSVSDSIFLNKNPHLGNKLPFVNALFPNARFIWIYRDLPSVAASLKKILNRKEIHYWPEKKDPVTVRCWECFFNGRPANIDPKRCFPGGDVTYLAEYWYETNKAISEFTKSIPEDRIFLIKEEELIRNPEKVLADCQSFLGIPNTLSKNSYHKIDRKRNDLWGKRLHIGEINSLLHFVNACGDSLNTIFPEENLLERYREIISVEKLSKQKNLTMKAGKFSRLNGLK